MVEEKLDYISINTIEEKQIAYVKEMTVNALPINIVK
jgi:hypothetical protein